MRSTIKVAHAAAGGGRRRISIFGFKIFIEGFYLENQNHNDVSYKQSNGKFVYFKHGKFYVL